MWWCALLIPAFGRQISEFQASLVYRKTLPKVKKRKEKDLSVLAAVWRGIGERVLHASPVHLEHTGARRVTVLQGSKRAKLLLAPF